MRQAVADLHHRGEVSQKMLDRYCSALAVIDDSTTLEELTSTIERRVHWKGKSVRALHPFDPQDHSLLKAVNRGEFTIKGLRNRDLQRLLFPTAPKTQAEKRQRSSAIGRKLRCCVPTDSSANAPNHTATMSLPRAARLSTPSPWLTKSLSTNSSPPQPRKIFVRREEIKEV